MDYSTFISQTETTLPFLDALASLRALWGSEFFWIFEVVAIIAWYCFRLLQHDTLKDWDPENLGPWYPKTLRRWDFETPRSRKHKTLRPWAHGTLRPEDLIINYHKISSCLMQLRGYEKRKYPWYCWISLYPMNYRWQ